MSCTIGILMPLLTDMPLGPVQTLPLGRAMHDLSARNIRVVLGDHIRERVMTGFEVANGSWRPGAFELDMAYDRFPSHSQPARFQELLLGLRGVPLANPVAFTALCRDKLACQRLIETAGIPVPEVVERDFGDALAEWGTGYLKPRHGSFGRGVRLVSAADGGALPMRDVGSVRGEQDQMILQRAVRPPTDWAGVSVRQLVQRRADGSWNLPSAALRRSVSDPVVNVARDAQVHPAQDVLSTRCIGRMGELSLAVCAALGTDDLTVEMGLDFVIDENEQPWLIEVNSRPRGRLRVLAQQDPAKFDEEHLHACCAPFERLAALVA